MEPTITKRLHISGLTPSISQQDLYQRLSTFGNVQSLDGLGVIDGVGRPRKFAYATLEATPAKLARCLNTLSGSMWKGAKVRIGEAKPDFRERLKAENEKYAAEAESRRKKRRWIYSPYQATHSKDMTPVTLETAKLKGGWVVTPLGRVYRPMRMRPLRPLPPLSSTRSSTIKKDPKGKRPLVKKKRIRKPDSRARRRKIDMVKYGSEYIKGRFLHVDVPLLLAGIAPSKKLSMQVGKDDDGGEESDDDVAQLTYNDEEENAQDTQSTRDNFEIVPRGALGKCQPLPGIPDIIEEVDVEMGEFEMQRQEEQELSKKEQPASSASKKAPSASKNLKDLFASTEAEGVFSLLGHLDLGVDLELDEDVPYPTTQANASTTEDQVVEDQTISVPVTITAGIRTDSRRARQASQVTLDPSQPLFFPRTLLATHPAAAGSSNFANPNVKNRPKDLFDTFKEKGWDWLSSEFYRTQNEDEIRKRWEEQKGELTQGWKKRWREAAKLRRRRGKTGGDEN